MPNKITVNLKVPAQANDERKTLNVSWRDVINAGLEHLKGIPPRESVSFSQEVEDNLKTAVKAISNAWTIVKANKGDRI